VAADQIEVVGSANRDVEPDQATWLAEVVVADADHRAAFDRCAERAAALVERLAPLGEASTGIVSVEPRLSPDRERWAGHEARRPPSRCAAPWRRWAKRRGRRWNPARIACTARC
jgi:uncharacterized protein YggE